MIHKLIAYFFLFLGSFAYSQTLSTQISKTMAYSGEIIALRLDIENTREQRIEDLQKKLLPKDFDLVSDEVSLDKDHYQRLVRFRLFEPGDYQIPALEFKVGADTLQSVVYQFRIISLDKANQSISDIDKNKEIRLGAYQYFQIYWGYILVLFLLVIGLFLFRYLRGKKKEKELFSPEFDAQEQLKKLQKKEYIAKNLSREFYGELLVILRCFLQNRFSFSAPQMFADDIISFLTQEKKLEQSKIEILRDLFGRAEMAKFAKARVEQGQMQADLDAIIRLVKESLEQQIQAIKTKEEKKK